MIQVIVISLLYNLVTALSIAFTGDRAIVSGDILTNIWHILFNWKFILAMFLSILSRFLFIALNNQLLKISSFAGSSTTITAFITASSYIFIILFNYLLLHEQLTLQQFIGSAVVVAGILIITL